MGRDSPIGFKNVNARIYTDLTWSTSVYVAVANKRDTKAAQAAKHSIYRETATARATLIKKLVEKCNRRKLEQRPKRAQALTEVQSSLKRVGEWQFNDKLKLIVHSKRAKYMRIDSRLQFHIDSGQFWTECTYSACNDAINRCS